MWKSLWEALDSKEYSFRDFIVLILCFMFEGWIPVGVLLIYFLFLATNPMIKITKIEQENK